MYPKGCVSFFVRKSNPRYKIKRGNALPEAAPQRPRRGGWAALHGRAFDPGFAVCAARRAKVLLTGRLVRGSVEREKKLRKTRKIRFDLLIFQSCPDRQKSCAGCRSAGMGAGDCAE
ncbi:hypothetical protein D1157_07665 [Anaerotruncus sp. X29]|nr:hypothetical protein [Anaerotruncus sp. 1XD42-93]NCE74878.1 hypothetical protein [Anaerotruncus sp. X29]